MKESETAPAPACVGLVSGFKEYTMTSMIDGLRLERLAGVYLRRSENAAAYERECRKTAGRRTLNKCEGGCGMVLAGSTGPCADCLRLIADTLRTAAEEADK